MIRILDDFKEDFPEDNLFNEGFAEGYKSGTNFMANIIKATKSSSTENKWTNIEDQTPLKRKKLLYYFEGVGTWLGFYLGRDEKYPADNDHIFGSESGFLTGDVTHWCYMPDYPKCGEWRIEADNELAKEMEENINKSEE